MKTTTKKIYFGSDHAGYETKQYLINQLKHDGYECYDCGCFDNNSCDYPDYAIIVGEQVANDRNSLGIVICGTGVGMCMAINKVPGILCGVAYNEQTAQLIKEHDNCNVLALGAREFDASRLYEFCKIFLNAEFANGRHLSRINKIINYENKK